MIFVAFRDHCRPFLIFFVTASPPSDLVELEMGLCYVTVLPVPKTVQ